MKGDSGYGGKTTDANRGKPMGGGSNSGTAGNDDRCLAGNAENLKRLGLGTKKGPGRG